MLAFKFTPIRRFILAIVAIGYLFSSHYLITGGLLLQILAICLGLGLTTLLITSLASSSVDESAGGLLQELMERQQAMDNNTSTQPAIVSISVPESL